VTAEEWDQEVRNSQWMMAQPRYAGGYAGTRAGRRKLRLYAVGCCRIIWHLLWDERLRVAVEVAERHADGLATDTELEKAHEEADPLCLATTPGNRSRSDNELTAARHGSCVAVKRALSAAFFMTSMQTPLAGFRLPDRDGEALLCDMAREIWGNFINPPVAGEDWLRWHNLTVVKMAQDIYDARTWEHLPILADALEDAGCDDARILSHCRGPGPHVRGCWVVDLLLGKG
jgi:hypothetical protein